MLDWNPSKKIEKWVDKYKEDLDLWK
jgi:hypothetical protein